MLSLYCLFTKIHHCFLLFSIYFRYVLDAGFFLCIDQICTTSEAKNVNRGRLAIIPHSTDDIARELIVYLMDRSNFPDSSSSITEETSDKSLLFKLYFCKDQLLGRSNLRPFKIEDDLVTPKFYSAKYENLEAEYNDENRVDKTTETLKRTADQPENICDRVNRRPPLTSHAYGWWHEQGIQPIESRINFRKRTSDLVNSRMKIYAEDQKLKTLKY